MKRIKHGRFISIGYSYKGYEVRNHGYYPPDKCNWWEAVSAETGEADFHAHTRAEIRDMIDAATAT